jgi:hypothetical protein
MAACPFSEIAQRVMDVCTPERFQARRVVGISPFDVRLDADELKQAIDNVEATRKDRRNSNWDTTRHPS